MKKLLVCLVIIFGFSSVIFAFEQPLKDAFSEQRAKDIFKSIKCAVCQGQSVLDSESDFAKSVRSLVREKISAGASDEQVYDFLKSNYGEKIMFKPIFDEKTALLWLLPFLLIFVGFIIVVLVLKRKPKQ
jgi:cytochrome c-type biogenesis protein CcmH